MGQPEGLDPDLSAVLSGFGLSDERTIQHLRTLNNSVFAISREGEQPAWVLRRHRSSWRDPESILAELDLLAHLGDHLPELIKVSRPGSSPQGDRLITVNGAHYSLLEWIPGSPRRPDSGLDVEGARLLGTALGTIHSIADQWDQQPAPVEWNASTLFTRHPGLMGADPAHLETVLPVHDIEFFDEIATRTTTTFDNAGGWGLIHADFILGNCQWATDGERTTLGVLDFDDFGRGPRLFDLGAVLGNLADYPETATAHMSAFLAGYRKAHSLPAAAEQDLPLMMAARHTSQCLWILGHQDLGTEWIATHLQARLSMARECLAVKF